MTDCAKLRDHLEDAALGEAETPALRGHLAECEACAAELERQRRLALRIDGAVRSVVRAEPPPQLPAAVAMRLTGAPRPHRPRNVLSRSSPLLALAAVLALIATIGFHAFERPGVAPSELSALMSWRSPTGSLLDLRAIPPPPSPKPGATHAS